MNRLINVSLFVAFTLLALGFLSFAYGQTPQAADLKPTLISPTPGLYVHGWPPFTVSYPKEWVEQREYSAADAFAVGGIRPGLPPGVLFPLLRIGVFGNGVPLEEGTKMFMPGLLPYFTDIKVLTDKPSRLKDGTPSREVEWEGVLVFNAAVGSAKNRPKLNNFMVMTKKDLAWVTISLIDIQEIGEDLKRIASSLTFLPGREEPLSVPPDVRVFLDMYRVDILSRDVKTIMAHYSDRFRHSGAGKAGMEQYFRNDPNSPVKRDTISSEPIVTVFEARGDKAYIDGFWLTKTKGDANTMKSPMSFQQIINEQGQWKWFGNQK
jgi:hypothetical protein